MEDRSESSLKPAIISCFIGNPDEFVVMQNELGFTDLTEELRSIINEPYCGNINEIVDVYADKLYQIIIRKIEEKDLEKKDSQKSFWNKERSTEEVAKGCLVFFALILLGIFLLVSFFTGN
jgi:hypothetical protein